LPTVSVDRRVLLKTDECSEGKDRVFYIRIKDNWVVLLLNRWKFKKAIQIINPTFNELKMQKNPDKTFIGLVAKNFDF
jgi:hypothetical protein